MTRQALFDEQPVQYVKGVGPARAQRLRRLGVETVRDLLLTPPRRYEDRSRLAPISRLRPGELATVRARVLARGLHRGRRGRAVFRAAMGDDSGVIECLWFNQPYLAQQIRVGDELFVYGQAEPGKRLQLIHPEIERADGPRESGGGLDADAAIHMGRIVPVYPLTEGIGQRWMRSLVHAVLAQFGRKAPETLPADLRQRLHLPGISRALEEFHFPSHWESLGEARRRLAFQELFEMQRRLAIRRARLAARRKSQRYRIEGPVTNGWRRGLPFQLTASQTRVLEELTGDLQRPAPMLRLLQGDVGCGKTIVAAGLIAVAAQSGYQVAVMVPTELLAEQHARVLRRQFEPLGVRVGLLAQGVPLAERKRVLTAVADGATPVLVGTHALIERDVRFHRLALVIIDEQHKFGVAQRSTLIRKAEAADVLVMTATPIPRTLALSLYGDLACSTIAEMPPGRRPVQTVWLPESGREQVYERIRGELRHGCQGYVVYPLVESSAVEERKALKAAVQMAKRLKTEVFPDHPVELLHGRMPPKNKDAVMRAFADGHIRLLVSTVIVEVGLDVPAATVMLIEHPERFGLAQLHQLRGRIGRGADPAVCFILSDAVEELARQRLQAFVETTDGFRLAERDLELRGPGELLGRSQSGWLRLRIADLIQDRELVELARKEAVDLIARRPELAEAR